MKIISAASAFPKHYYPQAVLLEALQAYWSTQLENPELLRRLHRNTGVEGRYLALPVQDYPGLANWGEVNDRWIEVAVDLGEQAICREMNHPGVIRAFEPRHPVLAEVWRHHAHLRLGRSGLVMEALVPAIIEQKVTGKEAFARTRRDMPLMALRLQVDAPS